MTKIEALRKTIYNLENNVYAYDWFETDSCNCGVLARTILGGKSVIDAGYSCYLPEGYGGTFSRKAICITTGMNIPLVFEVLRDAGFTHHELVELEYLGNKIIGDKAGLLVEPFTDKFNAAHLDFTKKKSLIKYLKAWVETLEEKETPNPELNRVDITKDLAVLPVEETSDTINQTVLN